MSNNTNSFKLFDAPISNQNAQSESITLTSKDIEKQIAQGAFFMSLDEACKMGLITENDNIATVSIVGE